MYLQVNKSSSDGAWLKPRSHAVSEELGLRKQGGTSGGMGATGQGQLIKPPRQKPSIAIKMGRGSRAGQVWLGLRVTLTFLRL
jgi:hypothetical protein